MLWLRRFTFLILVAAGLVTIYVAIHVFWNIRPYDYMPRSESQAQIVSDRLMLYSRQAEDVARLVAILLIVSGLYTIAQAILAQLAADRMLHRLDVAIDSTRHEFALAAGDLRELKEDVARAVERATAQTGAMEEIRADVRQRLGLIADPAAPEPPNRSEAAPAPPEPAWGAGMHEPYALACDLARQGAEDAANREALYAEAIAQLRTAMALGSAQAEKQLLADIEEGRPLHALANTPPFDAEVLDLLMNVSVA